MLINPGFGLEACRGTTDDASWQAMYTAYVRDGFSWGNFPAWLRDASP